MISFGGHLKFFAVERSERDDKRAGRHAQKSHPASLVSLLFVVNNPTATFSSTAMQHFDFVV